MRSSVLQTIVIAGLFTAYYFSSPSILERHKAQTKTPPAESVESATDTLIPDIGTATSTHYTNSEDPFLEPEPMATVPVPPGPPVDFIEIINSCGPHFEGSCVNARSGPATTSPSVAKLRNGVVLRIGEKVEVDGQKWYRIEFKEDLRYPERVPTKWYVSAEYARPFSDSAVSQLAVGQTATTTKRIVVRLSEQTLYAYDGDTLFMQQKVSTGIKDTPTPRGTFTIFKKMPSRYMQGPIPGLSKEYYDLPGVPWNMYFTTEGAIIHGAYWHNSFGKVYSHGCVNLPLDKAEELYNWADVGATVTITN